MVLFTLSSNLSILMLGIENNFFSWRKEAILEHSNISKKEVSSLLITNIQTINHLSYSSIKHFLLIKQKQNLQVAHLSKTMITKYKKRSRKDLTIVLLKKRKYKYLMLRLYLNLLKNPKRKKIKRKLELNKLIWQILKVQLLIMECLQKRKIRLLKSMKRKKISLRQVKAIVRVLLRLSLNPKVLKSNLRNS